jgi:hypothetical protein
MWHNNWNLGIRPTSRTIELIAGKNSGHWVVTSRAGWMMTEIVDSIVEGWMRQWYPKKTFKSSRPWQGWRIGIGKRWRRNALYTFYNPLLQHIGCRQFVNVKRQMPTFSEIQKGVWCNMRSSSPSMAMRERIGSRSETRSPASISSKISMVKKYRECRGQVEVDQDYREWWKSMRTRHVVERRFCL